ncbi:hypothetical protein QNN11_06310 [Phocaeicola dorei]|uniref:Uncharacterized protein n=1 Tax=Phocaeicola dorei TaxID=357276 RepID=A0AA95HYW8_9BACT|nr:hypothetical protein QNN11_06310 [Phocaeicola dorei]
MAVQNGKTGVPTGSRSDNHTFLVQGQQNLYIIEFKQVCTGEALRQSMKSNMHNLPEQIYGSF